MYWRTIILQLLLPWHKHVKLTQDTFPIAPCPKQFWVPFGDGVWFQGPVCRHCRKWMAMAMKTLTLFQPVDFSTSLLKNKTCVRKNCPGGGQWMFSVSLLIRGARIGLNLSFMEGSSPFGFCFFPSAEGWTLPSQYGGIFPHLAADSPVHKVESGH